MNLSKKEQDFLETLIAVTATVGDVELTNLINRKRDENRLKAQEDMQARLADTEAQNALQARIRADRIIAYYGSELNRPSFAITPDEIIAGEQIDDGRNLWKQAFRRFGEFSTTNPFYRMDIEQQLFFAGIADLRLIAAHGQMDAGLPFWMDKYLTVNDILAEFVPIEETDPELTFIDQIEPIRERLIAKRQGRIDAINDGLGAME